MDRRRYSVFIFADHRHDYVYLQALFDHIPGLYDNRVFVEAALA